jgi:hypothetical protein
VAKAKAILEGVKLAISSGKYVVGAASIILELTNLATPPAANDSQFASTVTRSPWISNQIKYQRIWICESSWNFESCHEPCIAIDPSLGDQLWPVSSTAEGVITACTGCLSDQPVTFRF